MTAAWPAPVAVRCVLLLILLLPAAAPAVTSAPHQSPSLIELYRLNLDLDPNNPGLHYALGLALLNAGQNDEAIAEFRLAYPALSTDPTMNYNFAVACHRVGDIDSALLYLEQVESLTVQGSPELYPLADLYVQLAQTCRERDDDKLALSLYRKALHLDPDRSELLQPIAEVLLHLGETTAAQSAFEDFLARHPDDRIGREQLFTLLCNQVIDLLDRQETETARAALQRARQLQPEQPLARYYLGYLAYKDGKLQEAAQELAAAYARAEGEVRASIPALLYNCALGLLQGSDPDAAWQALAPLLAEADPSVRDLSLAGNIQLARKDYLGAEEFYRRVLAREPTHRGAALNLLVAHKKVAELLFLQAQTSFRNDDYLAALAGFRAVLQRDSAYPLASQYALESERALQAQGSKLFEQASQALAQNDVGAALGALKEGNRLLPEDPRGIRLLQEAARRAQEQIGAQLRQAGQALAGDELTSAEQLYAAVLQLEPENAEARAGVATVNRRREARRGEFIASGQTALAQSEVATARVAFLAALSLVPNDAAAQAGLQQAEHLTQQLADAALSEARQARVAGRLREARQAYERALALRNDTITREELSRTLSQIEQQHGTLAAAVRAAATDSAIQKARTLVTKALAANPDDPRLLQLQAELATTATTQLQIALREGQAALSAQRFERATAEYRRALDIDPSNLSAREGLRQSRARLQQQQETTLQEADSAWGRGDALQAEQLYARILLDDPYHPQALAGMKRSKEKTSAAIPAADPERLYLQGIDRYTRGDYKAAVSLWQQVLALAPTHDKARNNIEKAQRKLHQLSEIRHD